METHSGRDPIELDGFSYLPRALSVAEGEALATTFEGLHPIWEQRHGPEVRPRQGGGVRRLTRPVFWLGGWQFASLGYYAEPDHLEDRCIESEPFPPLLQTLLERMAPCLRDQHGAEQLPPYNSALVNYYGSEVDGHRVVDMSRLRAHRDAEPGPVVMFSLGQPGLLEFVEEPRGTDPVLSLWMRHRSAVIISGARFKDHLYHRVTQVRHGELPALRSPLEDFRLRRISVSVRHVPARYVTRLAALPASSREIILPYVAELARHSPVFRAQLDELQANTTPGVAEHAIRDPE